MDVRYYTCLKCAYAITALEQRFLRFAVPCPACGTPKSFGPGVFIEDFQGYKLEEVMRQKGSKAGWSVKN